MTMECLFSIEQTINSLERTTGNRPNYIRLGVERYERILDELQNHILFHNSIPSEATMLFGIEVEIDFDDVEIAKVGYLEEVMFISKVSKEGGI